MSKREWKRVDAVERIESGRLTSREAAEVLGLSTRQVRRRRRAVEGWGAAGVVHGNRGRAPSNRVKGELRTRIVDLRRKKYEGFNDQHFTEKLAMTLMFHFASIPMLDRRSVALRPGYAEHMQRVNALIPWPPRLR